MSDFTDFDAQFDLNILNVIQTLGLFPAIR